MICVHVTFVYFFLSNDRWVTLPSSWGFIAMITLLLEPFTCFILLFSKIKMHIEKKKIFSHAKVPCIRPICDQAQATPTSWENKFLDKGGLC